MIFSVSFTFSSAVWDTDVAENAEELTHLRFGWPLGFYQEDVSGADKKTIIFPVKTNYVIPTGYDAKTKVIYGILFVDIIINFVLLYIILATLKRIWCLFLKTVIRS